MEQLREALVRHFGKDQLAKLRKRAARVHEATGMRPVAPDLWLVDVSGNHRFIEVKLPGDRVRLPQLEGMSLIASCLRPKTQLSIEIIELQPADADRPAG